MSKNIFFVSVLVVFGLFMACKSNKQVSDQDMAKMEKPEGVVTPLDMLVDTVGISGKVEEKFRKIYNKYQDKRMEVRAQGGKPNQMVKEVLMLRDKQNQDMKKILTDEQYAIYLEAIDDSKGRPAKEKIEQPVK